MKWIPSQMRSPPQGKKVLCFKNGDCWIAQRFGDDWIPMPFSDSRYATSVVPDVWASIEMPEGYTGETKIYVDQELFNIDELEKVKPETYHKICADMRKCVEGDNKVEGLGWRPE